MAPRNILVVGATGQQGGATVKALLNLNKQGHDFHVFAHTRDASSSKARDLAALQGVTVVSGALEDAVQEKNIDGVFLMPPPFSDDLALAKGLAEASKKAGVKQFVFSGVDFSGRLEKDGMALIDSKKDVEAYLKTVGFDSYTFLRPTGFAENYFNNPMYTSYVLTKLLDSPTKNKIIAAVDIGKAAANVFAEPQKYNNAVIGMAGDQKTNKEIKDALEKKTGREWKYSEEEVAKVPPFASAHFDYWDKYGMESDPVEFRKVVPDALSFDAFLSTVDLK